MFRSFPHCSLPVACRTGRRTKFTASATACSLRGLTGPQRIAVANSSSSSNRTNSPHSYITNSNFNCKTQRIYLPRSKGECRVGECALFVVAVILQDYYYQRDHTTDAMTTGPDRVIEPDTHSFIFFYALNENECQRIPALSLVLCLE